MSKKIRVKISWKKKSPLKMAATAHGTVSAMTGNSYFQTPDIALAIIYAAAIRVENAWPNRKNGALGKDELINSAIALDDLLHVQADYVSEIANGDATIIHSAGFISTRVLLQKSALPVESSAPVLHPMNGGCMMVKVRPVKGFKTYCFILVVGNSFDITAVNGQLKIPAQTELYIINHSKGKVIFTGLPIHETVQVAVMIINSAGCSGLSSVSTASTIL